MRGVSPGRLRIVVMGTGPFAVPMFRALVASPHAIAAVVTRPDHAPPGRRPPSNPMREAAVAGHCTSEAWYATGSVRSRCDS